MGDVLVSHWLTEGLNPDLTTDCKIHRLCTLSEFALVSN